jgi:UDP-N-acetylglucosamine--N-acetylmuramyl-(pentapeptide) pyrophosphoryl-undecaprenol N-acetylglucosamine transferase
MKGELKQRMDKLRFIITGGGTGGHIYPALAVALELRRRYPSAAFLYVGGKRGLEGELVLREGFDFAALEIRGMERKANLAAVVSAWKALTSLFQAMSILKKFRPNVVIGTGGYASFPVGAAAILCSVPLILHEQNVYPGLANRILGRYAKGVAISWVSSKNGFRGRAEIIHTTREEAFKRLGLENSSTTILVFGGSQGSIRLSRAAIQAMKMDEGGFVRYILATGKANFARLCDEARDALVDFAEDLSTKGKLFYIVPYIHEMAAALAVSDLVICRSGALTLAEITARGVPSVLVPHPNVPDDVQRKNAMAMVRAGASEIVEDAELTGPVLHEAIAKIVSDGGLLKRMGESAQKLGMNNAAALVADLAKRHMKGGDRS